MSETVIRVVIVDDHAMVRAGLSQLLEAAPGIEVVGSAADGTAALEVVADTSPDVVLMDLQMPGMDGVTATREIVGSGSPAQVVVLTSYSDGERIVAALDAGAVGYLLKDADPVDLVQGILAVHAASRRSTPGPRGSCWSRAPHRRARSR